MVQLHITTVALQINWPWACGMQLLKDLSKASGFCVTVSL